jgi:hypothetical protein
MMGGDICVCLSLVVRSKPIQSWRTNMDQPMITCIGERFETWHCYFWFHTLILFLRNVLEWWHVFDNQLIDLIIAWKSSHQKFSLAAKCIQPYLAGGCWIPCRTSLGGFYCGNVNVGIVRISRECNAGDLKLWYRLNLCASFTFRHY